MGHCFVLMPRNTQNAMASSAEEETQAGTKAPKYGNDYLPRVALQGSREVMTRWATMGLQVGGARDQCAQGSGGEGVGARSIWGSVW